MVTDILTGRFSLNTQLSTLNSQPDYAANSPVIMAKGAWFHSICTGILPDSGTNETDWDLVRGEEFQNGGATLEPAGDTGSLELGEPGW